VRCDFIAGCDGYHGVSRASVPKARSRRTRRVYPFGWLGVAADTPPVSRRAHLFEPRARLRALLDALAHAQPLLRPVLARRQGGRLERRRLLGRTAAPRSIRGRGDDRHRSFDRKEHRAAAQLRRRADALRTLFLAGDAAHIVPPTGAKGLNLAASDVRYLARGLVERIVERSDAGIDHYSDRCLRRIWKAERFSWWFTSLTHRFPETGAIGRKLQRAELEYLVSSQAASTALAENYVGLPFDDVA
jgi:p-hydroxybenzoate 3-monooxygenase